MTGSRLWSVLCVALCVALAAATHTHTATKKTSKPLKVIILAGQSNMEGQAEIDMKYKAKKESLQA